MLDLTVVAFLALAAFRLTRFIVFDTLIDGIREKVHGFLLNQNNLVGNKLFDLISCTWCTGTWISALVYWLYLRDFVLSGEAFLNVAAIAGIQGMIHALEPSDND